MRMSKLSGANHTTKAAAPSSQARGADAFFGPRVTPSRAPGYPIPYEPEAHFFIKNPRCCAPKNTCKNFPALRAENTPKNFRRCAPENHPLHSRGLWGLRRRRPLRSARRKPTHEISEKALLKKFFDDSAPSEFDTFERVSFSRSKSDTFETLRFPLPLRSQKQALSWESFKSV